MWQGWQFDNYNPNICGIIADETTIYNWTVGVIAYDTAVYHLTGGKNVNETSTAISLNIYIYSGLGNHFATTIYHRACGEMLIRQLSTIFLKHVHWFNTLL